MEKWVKKNSSSLYPFSRLSISPFSLSLSEDYKHGESLL